MFSDASEQEKTSAVLSRRPGVEEKPISDYAIIGDTRTAALVASDGSIDWFCFPRFDSPAVFCRLLDAGLGGYFKLGSASGVRPSSRSYLGSTNVLQTIYCTDSGSFRVIDFMPVAAQGPSRIVRIVEGFTGWSEIALEVCPTFDFARQRASPVLHAGGASWQANQQRIHLRSPVQIQHGNDSTVSVRHILKAGARLGFVLECQDSAQERSVDADTDTLLEQTLQYWEEWASRCTYEGKSRGAVLRSALVLKLLTYAPSGAIVAAPTTSLPEKIGGVRNWDYRYTWIRDASLILHAFMSIGYHEEAHAFFGWLESLRMRDEADTDLKIMYDVLGGSELHETILPHLSGYRSSRPVRVGNGAADQKQLDIYGEFLDAACYCYESMRMQAPGPETWRKLQNLANRAAESWSEPDEGIWEIRGGARRYLYSALQCWVALDRASRLARRYGLEADLAHWDATRETIRDAILNEGYNPTLGSFVQAFGETALDASALMLPLVGFLPATDTRVLSTMERIRESLGTSGLIARYLNEDGLPGSEAPFAICSFWLVDNLVLAGRAAEATELFEKLIGFANDVGLLAEEIDPLSGELLGNYPQGFTHLALILSAVQLEKRATSKRGERRK